MKIIDFHSHFFSAPFFRALAGQSPLPGDVESKLAALAAKTGIELPAQDVGEHLRRWLAAFREGAPRWAPRTVFPY